MHVSEEDLILHYYGEPTGDSRVDQHVSTCAVCQAEFARLQRVLSLVDERTVPDPPPSFERDMWARLQPQLTAPAHAGCRGSGRVFHTGHSLAASRPWCSPHSWPGASADGLTPVTPSELQADVSDRVLLVAVVDHLDRSEMVLVELLNAERDDAAIGLEQLRARELVAANRLYRQSAAHTGDEVMGATLEDLERVLLEIANAPADLSAEDFAALRDQIGPRGLLFRVRVVQSEMRERQKSNRVIG